MNFRPEQPYPALLSEVAYQSAIIVKQVLKTHSVYHDKNGSHITKLLTVTVYWTVLDKRNNNYSTSMLSELVHIYAF